MTTSTTEALMKGMSRTYHQVEQGKTEFAVRKPLSRADIVLVLNNQEYELSLGMANKLAECLNRIICELALQGDNNE